MARSFRRYEIGWSTSPRANVQPAYSHEARFSLQPGKVSRATTEATTAALATQQQLEQDSSEHPDDNRLRFGIGVHLGDVIEKADGTVYGDGVNIASRLHAIAEAGGIAASGLIRAAVKDKVGAKFDAAAAKAYYVTSDARAFASFIEGLRKADIVLDPQRSDQVE